MSRTILIMAGGTGGHVMPALAVADCLRDKGWHVVWLGTKAGLEAKLVTGKGYPMEWLKISGLRGKGLLRKVMMPLMLLLAFYQSAVAIFRNRPDVVLGMGGYTAFPGGMMASLLAKPLVVHEQNSIGGLTNRVLACLADKVLVAFPDVFRSAKDKPFPCGKVETEWCGNPVRAEISALKSPQERFAGRSGKLRLLVVGGSLGAQVLNESVPRALALLPQEQRPEVVHQAGMKHFEALKNYYAEADVTADVRPFIDDMAQLYAWCDMVVCRAGALTVAELAAAGVASLLVPYPYAVDDHQTANGKFLSDHGAAVLLPQAQLNPERLAELLGEATRKKLLEMAEAARELAKTEATKRVAEVCMELAA